jgi:8-oxo-dGTP pyrophosphatase MutT (NUDIX family)
MTTPTSPRPAATVVVLRDQPPSIKVLLVRRNDNVAFMAGAYVFPGGRVDDEDYRRAKESASSMAFASHFPDLTAAEELAYRVAAAREMSEEAALTLGTDDLVPMAHWVTPEVETRRYDTRFFLARLPDGQVARHDAGETTELVWVTPASALDQCRDGRIMLPPPTWTTIKRLTQFGSVQEALDWARHASIVRVQPQFVRESDRTLLTLPGDPLYPTLPGWEVPEDTRFVLEEGKGWKPVRA